MDLAVIDLEAPLAEQARAMAEACESVGFFQLPLSVIPRQVADDAWKAAADFFALPEEEKRMVEFPEPGYPYGYAPFRYETLAKSLDLTTPSGPDLKETFSVGPDCGRPLASPGAADASAWIRSPSLWPSRPRQLRQAWQAYYQALSLVAEKLMSVMAVALELPPTYFAPYIDAPMTSMRALHYPEVGAEIDLTGSIRAGAHTDYGTLTILRTDHIAGLEIQMPDGRWAEIRPDPDAFIVNLGDSIAQWTNNRWRSTLHRVSVTEHAARQSFAFFHMANWDAVIECLPTCRGDGETAQFAPEQAGPWLMRKFTSTVT